MDTRERDPVWRWAFWGVALANALPILLVRYAPFTDLPEHVASMATLGRMLPGGGGAPYVVALRESQYLLYHVVGALLARVVGDAVLANQLLLAVCAVAWPLSLRALLRALGRDERVAIFAPILFWNRALTIGFLPFVAAVPIAVFGLSLLYDAQAAPPAAACGAPRGRLRLVGFGALGLALFYTHVSAFVVFALTAAAMTAASAASTGWDARSRRRVTMLGALAPAGVAAAAWWRSGSLAGAHESLDVVRMPPLAAASAMPLWTFDLWTGHADEMAAIMWWTAFATVVIASRRSHRSGDEPAPPETSLVVLLAPFACTAAIYLATPFRVGAAAYLNVRLGPMIVMFSLLGLSPRRGRAGAVPLAMAGAASLLMSLTATFEMKRIAREMIGDFDALLSRMDSGARLALVNFEFGSTRINSWPYPFAGSFHRAEGGGLTSYSFTELAHWPVHYAAASAPPSHGPFWVYRPCAYRMNADGAYYDHVLVQGAPERFVAAAARGGPPLVHVASEGVFHLFAKAAGPPPESPERSPCARSAPRP